MSPPERESRPAGNGTAQSRVLVVRDDSDHTARSDNRRDLLVGAGGAR